MAPDEVVVITGGHLLLLHMPGVKLIRSKLNNLVVPFSLHFLLLLPQILKPLQKLRPILLAIKLLLSYTLLQTLMINEVATGKPPQKEHARAAAFEAADISRVEVHLFHRVYLLSDVSRNIGVG